MNKYTIADFNKQFPDENACLEWLKTYRYPNGIFCKVCGKATNHSKLSKKPIYSCNRCGTHVHPRVDTIFERSRTPLTSWFYAIFLMSATRCGISAKQLERELGVSYKTAWRMFKEIRTLYQDLPNSMSGEIEVDETYIGGRKPGKRGRGAAGKSIVFGLAQRKGDVSATVTPDIKGNTLYPIIKEHVIPNSMVYTDEYRIYNKLKKHGYKHKRVHHASKVWVAGDAHTNNIEGFWSVLKRGISGVYHAVSQKYLQCYVDEYMFRYNHRKDEKPMFLTVLEKI